MSAAAPRRRPLALIPARGGSKRIPRKNIVEFGGQPMLAYPIRAARESGLFDVIHVSTEDAEIAREAVRLGADTSLERPADLAGDIVGILPVAAWVLDAFRRRGEIFDDVVILFACAPFLKGADLGRAWATYLQHEGRHNLISVARSPVPAEWFYHRDPDGRLRPLSPGAASIRSQDLAPAFYETGTFTIFSAEWLRLSGGAVDDGNYVAHELDSRTAIDIDTPEDLAFARLVLAAQTDERSPAG